ncbi:hypothetical protein LCGC14_0378850 [marine sediment metagenome]|uniref:Terminase small subunit n=1 Tax=marine sediment metagenome TaxID=412755 RepID=A0A0F9TL48_9ZZZZ
MLEIEPTGSPQDYGFPEKPTAQQITTWTLQEKFLAEYRGIGAVMLACETAGHTYQAFKQWVDLNKFNFQKRYEDAQAYVLERMIVSIDRRAFEGYDHPVIFKGKVTDTYKAWDSNLAMFRVKKLDPSYRDNSKEVEDLSAIRESLEALRSLGTPRLEAPKVVDSTSHVVSDTEDEKQGP